MNATVGMNERLMNWHESLMRVDRLDHDHDKRRENLLPAFSIMFIALAVSGGRFG